MRVALKSCSIATLVSFPCEAHNSSQRSPGASSESVLGLLDQLEEGIFHQLELAEEEGKFVIDMQWLTSKGMRYEIAGKKAKPEMD